MSTVNRCATRDRSAVTLWDELARPAPAPLPPIPPVDTASARVLHIDAQADATTLARVRLQARAIQFTAGRVLCASAQAPRLIHASADRFVLRPPAGTFFIPRPARFARRRDRGAGRRAARGNGCFRVFQRDDAPPRHQERARTRLLRLYVGLYLDMCAKQRANGR